MKSRAVPGRRAKDSAAPSEAKGPARTVTSGKKPLVLLAQLPLPRPSPFARSGNAPLAAGTLAAALRAGGPDCDAEILDSSIADSCGDVAIAREIAALKPAVAGLSLYCWNSERSLAVARLIRMMSPGTAIVIGGPDVDPSGGIVSGSADWDFAVFGEGEEGFPALLASVFG